MKTENTTHLNQKYLLPIDQKREELISNLEKSISFVNKRIIENKDRPENWYSRNMTNLQYFMNECTVHNLNTYYSDSLLDRIKELLEFEMQPTILYFSFGKYKDRIVQDILQEDKDYCKWFSENVVGKDFNTLKILDFLHKTLINVKYIDKDQKIILDIIIRSYVPKEWRSSIDIEYILDRSKANLDKHLSYPSMTPWEEDMMEIWGYGDFC